MPICPTKILRILPPIVALVLAAAVGFAANPLSLSGNSAPTPLSGLSPSASGERAGFLADGPLPDAPQPQSATASNATANPQPSPPHQTKRILGIVPNFRSVTADERLPPTTTKEKFKLTVEDTFDYSAFIEVGILAGMSQAEGSEPAFHSGAPAYGRYYWHSFADNADGNLWVEFLLPAALREDPRYYTLGHGGFKRRTIYSISRLFITRDNRGNTTPNFSEVAGNGAAAGISNFYYPMDERTWTKTGQHWALQIAIDGLDNVVKEFWPEVNRDLFHGKY